MVSSRLFLYGGLATILGSFYSMRRIYVSNRSPRSQGSTDSLNSGESASLSSIALCHMDPTVVPPVHQRKVISKSLVRQTQSFSGLNLSLSRVNN